jgi:hypothetical protein
MKTLKLALIMTCLASYTEIVCAQIATTTSETTTNQTLLDNAKVAREEADKKNTAPKSEITTLSGKTSVTPTNLTDQEVELSKNYIHQGKANQIIKDNCTTANGMQSVCNGEVGNHKFMGMDPAMVKAVSQAYAMFGALAGDSLGSISKGSKALANDKKEAGQTPGDEKVATTDSTKDTTSKADKKANDYCKFIPTLTEGVATAVQMAKSSQLNADEIGNGDTAQKDALLKAAKSHDSRAKMAQIQAAGWWGGAACYAANAATGQFAVDKNLIIKMGAATLLGAFYQNEVSANKEYASKTRAVANQLPGKGDCNPVTDNLCYCSQASTENDPTYCLPGLHKKTIASSSYRTACTDNNLKIDPLCTCEKTNSCFETYLEAQSDGALNLSGLGYGTSPFMGVRSLARGELIGGTLNSSSYDQTSAIAKKALRELASKVPSENFNLTKDQKAVADAMMAKGLPASVANLMASNPPSSGAMNAAMAKIGGASSGLQQVGNTPSRASNIVDFSGGGGLGYKGASSKSASGDDDILAKFKVGGGKAAVNSKVLEFAQRAENQARQGGQIRKDNSTPLFEIISLRYQTSGRRLLEVEPAK